MSVRTLSPRNLLAGIETGSFFLLADLAEIQTALKIAGIKPTIETRRIIEESLATRAHILRNAGKGIVTGKLAGEIFHPIPMITGSINLLNTCHTLLHDVGAATNTFWDSQQLLSTTVRQRLSQHMRMSVAARLAPFAGISVIAGLTIGAAVKAALLEDFDESDLLEIYHPLNPINQATNMSM